MASIKDFNHIDLLYPSRYLKAADLRGKRVPVVIESIDPRGELQGRSGKTEKKPIVTLKGKEKLWVLPKTNARSIAAVYGNEVTEWIGKTVVLYGTRISAGGQECDAIRVDEAATRKHLSQRANGHSHHEGLDHDPDTGEVKDDAYLRAQADAARAEMGNES